MSSSIIDLYSKKNGNIDLSLVEDFNTLCQLFPSEDAKVLWSHLNACLGDPHRVETVAEIVLASGVVDRFLDTSVESSNRHTSAAAATNQEENRNRMRDFNADYIDLANEVDLPRVSVAVAENSCDDEQRVLSASVTRKSTRIRMPGAARAELRVATNAQTTCGVEDSKPTSGKQSTAGFAVVSEEQLVETNASGIAGSQDSDEDLFVDARAFKDDNNEFVVWVERIREAAGGTLGALDENDVLCRLEQAGDVDLEAQALVAQIIMQADGLEEAEDVFSPLREEPFAANAGDTAESSNGFHFARVMDNRQSAIGNLNEQEDGAILSILQVFPDVDPQFVVKQIAQHQMTAEEVVDQLAADSSYPKLKDRLELQRREERLRQFLDGHLDIEEFLLIFEDPHQYFLDQRRPVSVLYVQHALVQLQNDFRDLTLNYLQGVLQAHGNHYLPAYHAIINDVRLAKTGRGAGKRIRDVHLLAQPRTTEVPWPVNIEEQFFRELQFARYEADIRAVLEGRRRERTARIEMARANNELLECAICASGECLAEDFIHCPLDDRHAVCKNCVKQHAEVSIGAGRHVVHCTEDGCSGEFAFQTLRKLLNPQLVSLLLKRITAEELLQARIDNLEACPFCDFQMIMENPDDKVFRCQNPECLRQSCRACKEPNHVPLRCGEVEKASETAMRTFIENKMAEAMIRICPRCGKRLLKDSGCNKLICMCGQVICYVCRQPLDALDPYAHYQRGGPCSLHSSLYDVHQAAAQKAGEDARAKYIADHPNMLASTSKVNLTALVDARREEYHHYDGVGADFEGFMLQERAYRALLAQQHHVVPPVHMHHHNYHVHHRHQPAANPYYPYNMQWVHPLPHVHPPLWRHAPLTHGYQHRPMAFAKTQPIQSDVPIAVRHRNQFAQTQQAPWYIHLPANLNAPRLALPPQRPPTLFTVASRQQDAPPLNPHVRTNFVHQGFDQTMENFVDRSLDAAGVALGPNAECNLTMGSTSTKISDSLTAEKDNHRRQGTSVVEHASSWTPGASKTIKRRPKSQPLMTTGDRCATAPVPTQIASAQHNFDQEKEDIRRERERLLAERQALEAQLQVNRERLADLAMREMKLGNKTGDS